MIRFDVDLSNRFDVDATEWDRATKKVFEDAPKRFYGFVHDEMNVTIYRTPPSPFYRRTHNLYFALKRIGTRVFIDTVKAPYARYVNDGTQHMTPRRFWEKAIKRTLLAVERDLAKIARKRR